MIEEYYPKKIELYVQKFWKKNKTFAVTEDKNKKKYYCLSMIPYPSGNLHIGHVRNYTIGDVIARYQRMLGKNVLHPIGWDAFGLPAENAAIKNNTSPDNWTRKNIKYMKKQLKIFGFSYDWSRELTTCNKDFYIWEQWLFTELYKKNLAYKKNSVVNWCPTDKTVLANEQVINNHCWRCNSQVELKKIPQWFLKINKYAEELLKDLNKLKYWPKEVVKMQRNWIGRSEGIEIIFNVKNYINTKLVIYTTRPDTLMGVTYLIISLEHSLAQKQSKKNKKINYFIKNFYSKKIELNQMEQKGIFTGLYAIHPINNKLLPIWISNFVSIDYGTGAVMSVPAHNQKDLEFAKKYNLEIKPVILNKNREAPNIKNHAMIFKGNLFNSGEFDGLSNEQACIVIANFLEKKGIGKRTVYYRLKDWCVSRQRYWGTPIPMLTLENGKIYPVPKKYLPIKINKKAFQFKLNKKKLQKNIKIKNKKAFLETDTLDTFVESSWYYIRYTCPTYKKGMINKDKANYWLPIDQYIGGIEHATLHLMYFRFFHKLLRDIGLITSDEPAKRLLCQGMVVSNAFYKYENKKVSWISPNDVKFIKNKEGKIINAQDSTGKKVISIGLSKMSKSKKNGVNPQQLIQKYGADTIRLFIMFATPVNMQLEWNESGIKGINRFLKRIWKLVFNYIKIKSSVFTTEKINNDFIELRKYLHKTIAKVSDDINRRQSFNTAISAIMKLVKKMKFVCKKNEKQNISILQEVLSAIIRMLAPFTPHISFFLWKKIGGIGAIDYANWPKLDTNLLVNDYFKLIIQINGKKKNIMKLSKHLTENQITKNVINNELVKKYILGKKIKKIFFIKNKVINLIVN